MQILRILAENFRATVIMTRTSDNDLSNGVRNHRKKADFDERIKIINQKIVNMYLSIHLNYLTDTRYYGAQVFYNKNNEELAKSIQEYLNNNTNTDREVKKIPTSTYMYDKLKSDKSYINNIYQAFSIPYRTNLQSFSIALGIYKIESDLKEAITSYKTELNNETKTL